MRKILYRELICMSYDGLHLESCLSLLALEVQREGELVIWFSVDVPSGTRRWGAIYKYQGSFYGQATDAGQTGPSEELSRPFGAMISDVDITSLEIGGTTIPAKSFIQLLRKELRRAENDIPGLNSERIKTFGKQFPSNAGIKQRNAGFNNFLKQREIANANGSIFSLRTDEDSDEWEENFLVLVDQHGESVYRVYWDTGSPGAGVGVESIEHFLGQYWARQSDAGLSGPYETFREVFENESLPFRLIASTVERIWCSELTPEELVPNLILDEHSLDPGYTIEINNQPYEISEDFLLVPIQHER
jgi:hypothetical protein